MTMKRVSKKANQKTSLHTDSTPSRYWNQGEIDSDRSQGACALGLQNNCHFQNDSPIISHLKGNQDRNGLNRSLENLCVEIPVQSISNLHPSELGAETYAQSPLYQNVPAYSNTGYNNCNSINFTDHHRKREKMGIFKNLRRKFFSLSVRKTETEDIQSCGHIDSEEHQNPNATFQPDFHAQLKENSAINHMNASCDCSPRCHFKTFMSPKFSEWHSNTDHCDLEITRDKPGCISKDISRFNASAPLHKSNGLISKRLVDCGTSSGAVKVEDKPFRTEPVYELADCVEYDPVKERTRIWSPKVWSLTQELFRLSKFGWYWGPITRNEAEDKLTNQPDGAFLVRDSSDERYLLSLSFRSFGRTLHTRIEHCNGMFSFYAQPDTEGYPSIVDLIERSMNDSQTGIFYYSRSRSPEADQIPVRLTKPVSRFTQVQSLQHMCRFVIRQYTRYDHIQQLPLPNSLKGWIEENQYWAVS